MKKLAASSVLLLSLLTGGSAMADQLCKDAQIKVTNEYKNGSNPVRIKVLAINYYDKEDAKWRDNDLKNTEIANGSQGTMIEDLEYVGNEDVTQFQVKFQFQEDKGWSTEKWSNIKVTTDPKCIANKVYTITVTGTAAKK